MQQIKIALVAIAMLAAIVGPARAIEEDAAFDSFVRTTSALCMQVASRTCLSQTFAYIDADGSSGVTLKELRTARDRLAHWGDRHADELVPADRNTLLLSLWVTDLVGLERLHAAYDTDASGTLSEGEFTADLNLGPRPLPELFANGEAFDWQRIRARLGPSAAFLRYLSPEEAAP